METTGHNLCKEEVARSNVPRLSCAAPTRNGVTRDAYAPCQLQPHVRRPHWRRRRSLAHNDVFATEEIVSWFQVNARDKRIMRSDEYYAPHTMARWLGHHTGPPRACLLDRVAFFHSTDAKVCRTFVLISDQYPS